MDDPTHLANLVHPFTHWWTERVEYHVRIATHTPECKTAREAMPPGLRRHAACRCPSSVEGRAAAVHQAPLGQALRSYSTSGNQHTKGTFTAGARSHKPAGRPPAPLDAANLLAELRADTRATIATMGATPTVPRASLEDDLDALLLAATIAVHSEQHETVTEAGRMLRHHTARARVLLGYDDPRPRRPIPASCGECGGALVLFGHVVRCVGTTTADSCGVAYWPWQWLDAFTGIRQPDHPHMTEVST
ncbi:hypothetical protein ACMA1D_10755 [Streptomyces sp. 796.1]|uniref:hypothetical protein n=1 Tax=Streptomyces sp. 796.1 TaxID=3163029 RepID=UPI0039C963B5